MTYICFPYLEIWRQLLLSQSRTIPKVVWRYNKVIWRQRQTTKLLDGSWKNPLFKLLELEVLIKRQ